MIESSAALKRRKRCCRDALHSQKAANRDRRPRSHRDASSQHGSLMQEARGTPSPVPTHSFSASPWHRHQLTGSSVCANCAAPMSLCVVYSIHGLVALLLRCSVVFGGTVEHPAAKTFIRARLWHVDDAPTVRSSLSLIVLRRMSFVDQYFLGASGCRGVVRCLHMAWV